MEYWGKRWANQSGTYETLHLTWAEEASLQGSVPPNSILHNLTSWNAFQLLQDRVLDV